MSAVPVCVVGSEGRMGRFACALLERTPGFRVAGRARREDEIGRALAGAALGLDLTVAGLGYAHARRMLAAGVRPVVGTSGVREEERRALDEEARALGLGGRVVANFSPGAWLLARAAREAARLYPRIEIVERHHETKRDAPSGTALRLAHELEEASGRAVPVHALRLPGAYAEHAVVCGAPGELLELRHDVRAPEAFGAGILFALELAAQDLGVHWGLPWERRLGP